MSDSEVVFADFQQLLNECKSDENVKNLLMQCIETLLNKLKETENTCAELQNEMSKLTEINTFGITAKYYTLKESCANLRETNSTLQIENGNLKSKLEAREQELMQQLRNETERIENHYKNTLSEKEFELEVLRREHDRKIQELMNDVNLNSVESSLAVKQVTEKYKKEICELQQRVKENVNTSNVLRNELRKKNQVVAELREKLATLKEKNTSFNPSSEEHEQNQQIVLGQDYQHHEQDHQIPQPQRYSKYDESTWDDDLSTFEMDNNEDNALNLSHQSIRYVPLAVSSVNHSNTPCNTRATPKRAKVYRSSFRYKKDATKNKQYSPPVVNFVAKSNSTEENVTKKRKLYNPNDLSYFDESSDKCK